MREIEISLTISNFNSLVSKDEPRRGEASGEGRAIPRGG